jgi:Zn-dependent protease
MLATLAGPAAQLLAAIVALLVLVVVRHLLPGSLFSLQMATLLAMRVSVPVEGLPTLFPLLLLLYFCILVNLLLFVFNLVPLPFLDGGKILLHYLPYNAAQTYQSIGLYLMFGFMFFGFYVIEIVFFPVLAIFKAILFSL